MPDSEKLDEIIAQTKAAFEKAQLSSLMKSMVNKLLSRGQEAVNEKDPTKKEENKNAFEDAYEDFKDAFSLKGVPETEGEALGDLLYKALMSIMGPLNMATGGLRDQTNKFLDKYWGNGESAPKPFTPAKDAAKENNPPLRQQNSAIPDNKMETEEPVVNKQKL